VDNQEKIIQLEKSLAAKEKIIRVLMNRVERSIDSVGGAYTIFERNILLQDLVDQSSKELEKANRQLSQEIGERIDREQRLQSVIQGSPIPTFVIGRDHNVIYWNHALTKITGISSQEIVGTSEHWRAFYDRKRPCIADLLIDGKEEDVYHWYAGKKAKSYLTQGSYEATSFFPALGESGKWLRLTAASIRDARNCLVGAIETLEDITERIQAEENLLSAHQQLLDIIEFLPDATYVVDRRKKIIAWNRAMEEQTGVMKKDIIGKMDSVSDIAGCEEIFPFLTDLLLCNHVEIKKKYDYVEKRGDAVYTEVYSPLVYFGRGAHLLVIASPFYDQEGKIIGAIQSNRDISEQKRLEQERAKLEERLHRAEKMEALGTLAGGVAHDLNNVLGVLVGYAELLQEKITGQDHQTLKRYASSILQASERGAAIIQDLLTLARRGVASPEVVNLNTLIIECFNSLEFEGIKCVHPGVVFRMELEKDLMNIKGSTIHLTKSVMNLLINAAESIFVSGEVTVATENRYLDRPIADYEEIKEGDYVVLRVTDTGKGIEKNDMGQIFEPFYTKKVMGRSGTGLGLAVVWGTVKDHQAYIDVSSEVGKGSSFMLYFPVTREEIAHDRTFIAKDSYSGRGETILVVDDVQEQRALAMDMLRKIGYKVCAVASGEEAVAYLKDNNADVVVVDMIMDPGIDGLETYRRILEINPRQKAIIVSGFSETDRVKKALELGAGAYVRKPYMLNKIGLTIRKELDRKQAGQRDAARPVTGGELIAGIDAALFNPSTDENQGVAGFPQPLFLWRR